MSFSRELRDEMLQADFNIKAHQMTSSILKSVNNTGNDIDPVAYREKFKKNVQIIDDNEIQNNKFRTGENSTAEKQSTVQFDLGSGSQFESFIKGGDSPLR